MNGLEQKVIKLQLVSPILPIANFKYGNFFCPSDIINFLESYQFKVSDIYQTLENPGNTEIEQPISGFGNGSFVVIKGEKDEY